MSPSGPYSRSSRSAICLGVIVIASGSAAILGSCLLERDPLVVRGHGAVLVAGGLPGRPDQEAGEQPGADDGQEYPPFAQQVPYPPPHENRIVLVLPPRVLPAGMKSISCPGSGSTPVRPHRHLTH